MAELINIYLKSIEAVMQQFVMFFPDKETRVVDVANNSHMKQVIRKYTEVEFPYFALQITGSSVTRDGLPAKNLQRTGVVGGINTNKTARIKLHVIPNTTNIKVIFATNNIKDLYRFIQVWLLSAVSNDMNFILEANGSKLPINLALDDTLSVPELENEDIGPIFLLETNLEVKTFIGEAEYVSLIHKIVSTVTVPADTPVGYVPIDITTSTLNSDLNEAFVTS